MSADSNYLLSLFLKSCCVYSDSKFDKSRVQATAKEVALSTIKELLDSLNSGGQIPEVIGPRDADGPADSLSYIVPQSSHAEKSLLLAEQEPSVEFIPQTSTKKTNRTCHRVLSLNPLTVLVSKKGRPVSKLSAISYLLKIYPGRTFRFEDNDHSNYAVEVRYW